MPLRFEEYLGHETDRCVCRFTMADDQDEVQFAVSWELMDELERGAPRGDDQRDEQFAHLQEALISIARQKFLSLSDGKRPDEILLDIEDRQLYA